MDRNIAVLQERRFWDKVDRDNLSAPTWNGTKCWLWTASQKGPDIKIGRGYGIFLFDGRLRGAHQVAWILANGPIENGLHVLHHCDNTICVNPEHLFLGTNLDNARDMVAKGRAATGNKNGSRTHPEAYEKNRARGDRNGRRQHPEAYTKNMPRGDRHYSRLHPELVVRGDRHKFRKHPELARGTNNGNAKLTEQEVLDIRKLYSDHVPRQLIAERFHITVISVSKIGARKSWKHLA